MNKLMVVIFSAAVLTGCSSQAERLAKCESEGVSRDACYIADQNRQATINAAAEKQALENAAKQYAQTSHKHREELAQSGCTQVQEANGECTVAAKNNKEGVLKQLSSEADAVINGTIADGAEFLLKQGWKPNNGVWKKQGYTLRLVVENDIVVNAQLTK